MYACMTVVQENLTSEESQVMSKDLDDEPKQETKKVRRLNSKDSRDRSRELQKPEETLEPDVEKEAEDTLHEQMITTQNADLQAKYIENQSHSLKAENKHKLASIIEESGSKLPVSNSVADLGSKQLFHVADIQWGEARSTNGLSKSLKEHYRLKDPSTKLTISNDAIRCPDTKRHITYVAMTTKKTVTISMLNYIGETKVFSNPPDDWLKDIVIKTGGLLSPVELIQTSSHSCSLHYITKTSKFMMHTIDFAKSKVKVDLEFYLPSAHKCSVNVSDDCRWICVVKLKSFLLIKDTRDAAGSFIPVRGLSNFIENNESIEHLCFDSHMHSKINREQVTGQAYLQIAALSDSHTLYLIKLIKRENKSDDTSNQFFQAEIQTSFKVASGSTAGFDDYYINGIMMHTGLSFIALVGSCKASGDQHYLSALLQDIDLSSLRHMDVDKFQTQIRELEERIVTIRSYCLVQTPIKTNTRSMESTTQWAAREGPVRCWSSLISGSLQDSKLFYRFSRQDATSSKAHLMIGLRGFHTLHTIQISKSTILQGNRNFIDEDEDGTEVDTVDLSYMNSQLLMTVPLACLMSHDATTLIDVIDNRLFIKNKQTDTVKDIRLHQLIPDTIVIDSQTTAHNIVAYTSWQTGGQPVMEY